MRAALVVASLMLSTQAVAYEPLIDGGVEEAWAALKKLPPRVSWEFALSTGYGDVPYWRDEAQAWMTMGGRFSMGRHLEKTPAQRFGGSLSTTLEGAVPHNFAWVIEPAVTWDTILAPLQVGVSVGPAFSFNAANRLVGWDTKMIAGPSAALRIGYSENWSRVGRRFHVLFEPKIRYQANLLSPTFSIVIGSGMGR
ncbi:MAG: hypothetical protein KC912_12840 [Proteobacteria bacterium]|nr:hypothetical protein [Pseudomonadota bacterium]